MPGTEAAGAEPVKKILVLQSYQPGLPAADIIEDHMRATINAGSRTRTAYFTEYLDAARFPGMTGRMAGIIREKYAGVRFDLAVAMGPEALQFLVNQRQALLGSTPLIFAGIREDRQQKGGIPGDVSGVVSRFDLVKTVDLALRLQPDARQIVVVTGTAGLDKDWEARARATLDWLEPRVRLTYLSARSKPALLASLGQLPRDAVVLFLSFLRDAEGRQYVPQEIVQEITDASAAPIYSIYSTYLDRGIVGGFMDTFERTGDATGALALRFLQGDPSNVEPTIVTNTAAFYVDWRQLRRWNMSESALPNGTILMHKEVPFWVKHRDIVMGVVATLVIQTGLIVALLIQGRRRRVAEKSLVDSEARMSLAATSANLGLWHWDISTDSIWATDHCRSLLQIPADSTDGLRDLVGCFREEDREALRSDIARATRTTQALDAEYRLRRPEETTLWIRLKGRATLDKAGNPIRLMGVAIDVSDRKKAEMNVLRQQQQLAHLTRVVTLGSLSGALAHELNQPLTAIVANAQAALRLLERGRLGDDEAVDILLEIAREGTRAGEVISRLRTLLRNREPQLELLSINEIISEVLRLLHGEFVGRNIKIETQLPGDLPLIKGDRIELEQMVLNLVVNASEAMAGNGRDSRVLRVETSVEQPEHVVILVMDQGPGIAPAVQKHLFDPFVTTKVNGLGLGLSITRTIIESHGGRISASNAPKGAEFRVVLPVFGGGRPWKPQPARSSLSTMTLPS